MRIKTINAKRKKLETEWMKWLVSPEGKKWIGFSFENYLIKKLLEK